MVIDEITMSFTISYMSAVVEMRQIIGRTRQQFDKDGCGIAWGMGGANAAIDPLSRVNNLPVPWFKEQQPLPVDLPLLLAVFTQNSTSCWWQADRNVNPR